MDRLAFQAPRAAQAVAAAMVGLSLLAIPVGARSAEIKIDKGHRGDRPVIFIEGDIVNGDLDKFRRLALTYDDAVVALASQGGATAEALEIGKVIRIKGYDTFVADQPCNSACALIWLAGRTKFLSEDGRVGFHATYTESGGRKQESGVGNAFVGAYLSQLNMSETAVAFTTSASPDQLNMLTPKNAEQVGIPVQVIPNEEQRKDSDRNSATGTRIYKQVGNWSIRIDDTLGGGCFVFATFEGDVALRFGADTRDGRVVGYAMLFGKNWTSIEPKADYPIEIIFGDSAPWKIPAHGTQLGTVKGIGFYFERSRFFDAVSKSPDIRVRYQNKEVAHLDLQGSSAAMDAMVQCQTAQWKLSRDPFAKTQAQDNSSRDPFAR